MELVRFRPNKEQEFERHFLRFASDRYNCRVPKAWSVAVSHVQDSGDWADLFDIARYSHIFPDDWTTSDAYSITWDVPTLNGFKHLKTPSARRQLLKRMLLNSFAAQSAHWATKADLATLLHVPLMNCIGAQYQMPTYPIYVLCHEVEHVLEDWTGKALVKDGVPPEEDAEVIAAMNAFVDKAGGWTAIKRLYLL